MKIKHRVLKDFQIIIDNKVLILKTGTILERYVCILNGQKTLINKEIVDSNPEYFLAFDWNQELIEYLKSNKVSTPAQVAKKITPFIESLLLSESDDNSESNKRELELRERALKEKEYYLNRDRESLESNKSYNEKLHTSISEMLDKINEMSKGGSNNEQYIIEHSKERGNYISRIKELEIENENLSNENRELRDKLSELEVILSNPIKLNEIIKSLI